MMTGCLKKAVFLLLIAVSSQQLKAQDVLDNYIKEAIRNNIVLKQKRVSYQKAIYSLKTANTLFLPSVSFNLDYTSGEGGRAIDIPVSKMLNPVYSTLNQLTNSNSFPTLNDMHMDFFPHNQYDAKVRTVMPVLNTDLIYNKEIEEQQVSIRNNEVDLYSKDLIKEVKNAYYNYLSALTAEKIYATSLNLANEGKRTNEALLKNGNGLPVYVLRAESEIQSINSKIKEAQNNTKMAKRYFNFLLNRNEEENINAAYTDTVTLAATNIDTAGSTADREEIKSLNTAIGINKSVLAMNENYWVPKINAFADFGVQDELWNWKKQSKYYLVGLQLEMPVFEFFRSEYKTAQAELELNTAELDLQNVRALLKMKTKNAYEDVELARENYKTAVKQFETAKAYYSLIEKGYKQGQNTFIETVDARTQYTQAELLVNVNRYKTLIAIANFERETGSNHIK